MKKSHHLVGLLEVAIMAGLAFVLGLLPTRIGFFEMELGMIPILLLSFRRGTKAGLLSGFIWGLLKVVFGNIVVLTAFQVFIEYFLAFALAGLGGLGAQKIQQALAENNIKEASLAVAFSSILACLAKYLVHFFAGVAFWSSYAPEGMGAWTYSILVNGVAFLLTALASSLVSVLILRLAPELLKI